MTRKHLLITAALISAFIISTGAYADGSMGGGMGGGQGMMGGQGRGMMGNGGAGMMDSGPSYSNPLTSPQSRRSPTDLEKQFEREKLRGEIRKKRQELSELYTSDEPDKVLIDQKIAELHALEADYDRSLFSAE